MHLFIDHRTEYHFSEPQNRLVQLLRMTPPSHEGQNIVTWRIDVDCDCRLRRGRDGFGNETTMLYVDGPISRIVLTVTGEVLTEDRAGLVSGLAEPLPPAVFLQSTALTRGNDAIDVLAHRAVAGAPDPLSRAHRLKAAVHRTVRCDPRPTPVERTAIEVHAAGEGSAPDIAHLLIAAARAIGLPARYVSGYRHGDAAAPVRRALPHGWVEFHIDDYGWIGFDAAHDICPQDGHVRVAVGLDYRDAAPVAGARIGGGEELLDVEVQVGLTQRQE